MTKIGIIAKIFFFLSNFDAILNVDSFACFDIKKKKASDAIFDTIAITETGIYYVTLSIMQIWYI